MVKEGTKVINTIAFGLIYKYAKTVIESRVTSNGKSFTQCIHAP